MEKKFKAHAKKAPPQIVTGDPGDFADNHIMEGEESQMPEYVKEFAQHVQDIGEEDYVTGFASHLMDGEN